MITLRPHQIVFDQAVKQALAKYRRVCAVAPTGCHAAGQRILKFDGSLEAVECVRVNDLLMGPDSNPRIVIGLCRGKGTLYRIVPVKGTAWIVNEDHILSLVRVRQRTTDGGNYRQSHHECRTGEIVNVSVKDYLRWSPTQKHLHKLYRSNMIEFPSEIHAFSLANDGVSDSWHQHEMPVDPYFFGLLLGDGSWQQAISIVTEDQEIRDAVYLLAEKHGVYVRETRKSGNTVALNLAYRMGKKSPLGAALERIRCRFTKSHNKFVPQQYRTSDLHSRLELLAGLMDTDGHHIKSCFDYITKSLVLANDVVFMSRSCGLAAYVSECTKGCNGKSWTYYRVCISGDVNRIPCRIKRKQAAPRIQKKSVLRTGFDIEYHGIGDYYGFTLSHDGLYLLDDFTVTHNSGKRIWACDAMCRSVEKGNRCMLVTDRQILVRQARNECRDHRIPYGVIMGQEPRNDEAPIQICSLQTLERREWKDNPAVNWAIVDEAHHGNQQYKRLFDQYSGIFIVGLTATPVDVDGKLLVPMFDTVIEPIKNSVLIRDGWLLPTRVFCPCEPDIKGVKIIKSTGEYSTNQVGERVESMYVHADVWKWWEPHQEKQTIAFVPRLKFARFLVEEFNRRGHVAEIIEASTLSMNRDSIFNRFEDRQIRVLVSVDVLREGFDAPVAQCAIDLQPNAKLRTWWQKVGRIRRPFDGQDHAVLLDFAGNFWRHETHPDEDPEWPREGQETTTEIIKKKRETQPGEPWQCPNCAQTLLPWQSTRDGVCPNCGATLVKARRRVVMGDGAMKQVRARQPAKKKTDTDVMLWFKCLYPMFYSGNTLNVARSIFHKTTGRWPDSRKLPFCPDYGSSDWKRPVRQVFPQLARNK